MKIGNFELGKDGVYIVAELSANHAQSIDIAKKSIVAAKEAGADAIKLQTYDAASMTLNVEHKDFMANPKGAWAGKKLYELYEESALPWQWHKELFAYAKEVGIDIFSSPFDTKAVDFLEQFEPVAYKIASFEITDYNLIEYTAKKQRPLIISTGVATIQEIQDVVDIARGVGNEDIVLLQCTSSYPAPLDEANLAMIPSLAQTFGVLSGFSDHTLGVEAPIVATTLGAVLIEKHFILDKSLLSADASFSLDKKEFAQMVQSVRKAQALLGKVDYSMNEKKAQRRHATRSLYVVQDIKKGEVFTHKNIKAIRPGYGMHPKHLQEILGKKAQRDYKVAERFSF